MRRAWHWLGAGLSVAGLLYLAAFGWQHAAALSAIELSGHACGGLVLAVAVYQLTFLSAAAAWRLLLAQLGEPIPFVAAFSILARSQVAKYLPGNVGHYVGRVVLARGRGLAAGPVVVTMALEMAGAVLAGTLIAALGLFGAPAGQSLRALATRPLAVALVVAGALFAGGLLLLGRQRVRGWLRLPAGVAEVPVSGWYRLVVAVACLGLFGFNFVVMGVCAALLAQTVLGASGLGLPLLTSLFAAGWVVGFVTPGAPAGLGVREAILVAGLDVVAGAGTALLLPLLFRLVTTVGDTVGFGVGWLTRRNADG